ncbi:MAG TPA: hypothetical protein VE953_01005 [Terriglobales bacterium]|nr:hypothetical protein [Terriglobales bacterium]
MLLQDVEEKSDEEGGGKRLRQGTSAERICSVHDPEMRYGRESASVRFDGHKAHVVADVATGLVVTVDVVEGSAKDEAGSLELIQEAGATTGLEIDRRGASAATRRSSSPPCRHRRQPHPGGRPDGSRDGAHGLHALISAVMGSIRQSTTKPGSPACNRSDRRDHGPGHWPRQKWPYFGRVSSAA